jgi:hypothetical protein
MEPGHISRFLGDFNIKSFKIIKDAKGKNRYFEKYEDLKNALETQFNHEKTFYKWVHPFSPKTKKKKEAQASSSRSSKNDGNLGSANKKQNNNS